MSQPRQPLLTVLVLLIVVCGGARTDAAEPEIVFEPPLTVVVRQNNGGIARGKLLALKKEELTLRTLNGEETVLKLKKVRLVRSADEQLEFRPDDETFDELAARVRQLPGASLKGGQVAKPADADVDDKDPEVRRERNRRSRREAAEEDDDDRRERLRFDSARPSEEHEEQSPPAAAGPASAGNPFGEAGPPPPRAGPKTEPPSAVEAGATEVLVCSNCEHDLPSDFRSGSECPHCGMVAVFEEESAATAATGIVAPPQNPFAAPGGAVPPVHEQLDVPAHSSPPPAPAAVNGDGLGLANMPLIAKVGIFAGFVVAGWFLMQRR